MEKLMNKPTKEAILKSVNDLLDENKYKIVMSLVVVESEGEVYTGPINPENKRKAIVLTVEEK